MILARDVTIAADMEEDSLFSNDTNDIIMGEELDMTLTTILVQRKTKMAQVKSLALIL